jgi:hypothetical protein
MSGLPPIATVELTSGFGCFVPGGEDACTAGKQRLDSITPQTLIRSVVGTAKTKLFVERTAHRATPWLL